MPRLNSLMTAATITIRSGQIADIAAIGEIVAAQWQHIFRDLLPQDVLSTITPQAQKARHERIFAGDSVRYLVALKAGQVVGFASWGPGRARDARLPYELYALYLRPEFVRQGIGSLLMKAVMSDIASAKGSGLYLTALEMNPNTAFYTRLGGIRTGAPDIRLAGASYRQVGFIWRFAP